jgi:leucyl-tRNA synthetase
VGTGKDSRTQSSYLEREIDRTITAVAEEYERFRFHRVVSEVQRFARLLRRYAEYGPVDGATYERGLGALTRFVAPMAPYLGEEMWNLLDTEGMVVEAEWPAVSEEIDDYELERRLVDRTLDDVRDITEVVDIDDPGTIEIVVAEDWKYRAYRIARQADPDAAIVGEIMRDDALQPQGDAAADYAADLADRSAGLEPVVDGDRELEVLEQAAWLFAEEFDAEVTVRRATEDDDLAGKARPNKPAIHIS